MQVQDLALTNRTALITGGSLGLGRAMAEAYYQAGARVAIVARRQEPLDAAVAEISAASGGEIAGFSCDVSDNQAIEATYAAVQAQFGDVDILVNNAGHAAAKPFPKITDEDWILDIDLKLMAAVRFARLAWSHMADQRWGRIINVLNSFAKAPSARTAPTSVTRAAGMALTKVLSAEGAKDNILVNAMLIGLIESDQIRREHERSASELDLDAFIVERGKALPMGRMGKAHECANLAHFLASEASSYITGCAINMDGGLSKVP